MSDLFLDNYNALIDVPDDRDITVEELGLLSVEPDSYPETLVMDKTPILNQGNIGACTIFGLSGTIFESTYADAVENGGVYNQPFDPWHFWEKAKERGASDTQGWSLQGALQLAVDLGYIVGYARLATPGTLQFETVMKSIFNRRPIYSGSARGNWRAIGKTNIYEESDKLSGHAYGIGGYIKSKRQTKERNSWSESWGDKGFFYRNESDLKNLYSAYIILDPSDVDKMKDIRNAKARLYADSSKTQGIWNGERPDDIATDEEIRIMLGRAIDILGSRSRSYWANIFEEKILRGKGILKIWNEKEGKKNATAKEVATMFTRSVKRDPKALSKMLTRFQVSAVIGRDIIK